jgi:hypothetical protein
MNPETEKKLLTLTREIKELDKAIVKERMEKGKEDLDLRKRFYETEEEIMKILGGENPLDDIRNPMARDTLRKVRNRSYFLLDKEARGLEDMIKKLSPDVVEEIENFLKSKGTEVAESEIDEEISRVTMEFSEEIHEKVNAFEYFERKKEIGTIISDTKLPKRIHDYFWEIRECFLLGLMYPAVGLCRVLLEIAFKDRFRSFGLDKKYPARNVHSIDDYKIKDIIRAVCNRLGSESLKDEAEKIWIMSSDILHGREAKMKLETSEVLEFIRGTFNALEKLYRS